MAKPTHYLWITDDMNKEEVEQQKKHWTAFGFRVVLLIDGDKYSCDDQIYDGLRSIIKNHVGTPQ